MPGLRLSSSFVRALTTTALALAVLGACAEEYTHGYVQSQDSIAQIQVGSSREKVLLVLGSPSTTSTIGGESYYYISQRTERNMAFATPSVVDQRVLAVYFDDKGIVKEVANYGLQDGKIFDFISRRTKTTGQDTGLLGQILKASPGLGLNK
ncbi:MAG: outer membrane protein assembly factor BamE [Ancalomicrobiaceae bacterium]|nr:outer membrane protein assembly factor BamE [Ancalomicrobiaceae bacterium]